MILDMHIHTIVSSPCSIIDPVDCIERVLELGFDGFCITEHETLEGARVVKDLTKNYSEIKVFSGLEVMSREGHLLIYGYDEDIPGVIPARDVVDMVTARGGIVIPAHPWRYPFGWCSSVLDKPVEETEFPDLFKIIELYNGLQSIKENQEGENYCKKTDTPGIGGSDAHWLSGICSVTTEFEEDIEDERHLVEVLKSGKFSAKLQPSYYEEQNR